MKTKEIVYGAVGLGILFLAYRTFKKRQKSNLDLSKTENVQSVLNKQAPSDNYTKQEANAKALTTVKDWIKTYDGLSNDVLNQKSKTYFDSTIRLNELKSKTNRSKEEEIELAQLSMANVISQNNMLLKEKIAQLKNTEYEKVYNVLKDIYSKYSKSDVDKLMIGLPKVLSAWMVGDDYKYTSDVADKLTIDDKLFLSDINFYKTFQDTYELKYPRKSVSTFGMAGVTVTKQN